MPRNTLPEELIEKIVAMMPFPSIFKARLLSRSWLCKFESISSLFDEEKKRAAASFQKQVVVWSRHWETFYPVTVSVDGLITYNPASQRTLVSWSFLPKDLFPYNTEQRSFGRNKCCLYLPRKDLQMEGALLYGCLLKRFGTPLEPEARRVLFVANIFTRKLRLLPPCPDPRLHFNYCLKLVSDLPSQAYKVILIFPVAGIEARPVAYCYQCHVYESVSEKWSSKKFHFPHNFSMHSSACLNGMIYMAEPDSMERLFAFNVKEETLEQLRLSSSHDPVKYRNRLAVCNADLLLISVCYTTARVWKIDLMSLQLCEVARCPLFHMDMTNHRVGDCIFFKIPNMVRMSNYLGFVEYNKGKDKWRVVSIREDDCRWSDYSFQPGLNPFMAV